jgi:hypothetical protein
MDEMPKSTVNQDQLDPLHGELKRYLESFEWVDKAEVRMREEGHVFFGEAFVVPKTTKNLVENVVELSEKAKAFNWRVHDLTVMPVDPETLSVDGPPQALDPRGIRNERLRHPRTCISRPFRFVGHTLMKLGLEPAPYHAARLRAGPVDGGEAAAGAGPV